MTHPPQNLTLSERTPSAERAMVLSESHAVLAKHARSFSLAAVFLPRARRDDAAVLYAFCRAVDDAVDEASDAEEAERALVVYREGLDGRGDATPLVCGALRAMAARRGMPLRAAHQLIDGMESDLGEVRVGSDRELLRYCYHAAGTVGWLMCGVLGVDARRAIPHAVDLGIAMQLTNICRDVAEDARRGRVYLPEDRLRKAGVSGDDLLASRADPEAVAKVVRDLLALADRYYASADAGMCFIPARPRLAIYVAARVYRAIGVRLRRRHGGDALHGRTFVPRFAKAGWVGAAVGVWLRSFLRSAPGEHHRSLHDHLQDLLPST